MPKAAPVSACTEPGAASFWVFGNVKAKEQTGEAPNYNKDSIKVLDLSNCTGLTSIGSYAFVGSGLTSIDLSNTNVDTIPHDTFADCYDLANVKLPKGLETIEGSRGLGSTYGAFERCDVLEHIYFYTVPKIEDGAFAGVIYDNDPAGTLTIHYPSSWDDNGKLERLKAALSESGLTLDHKVVFNSDPTLATLTSFLGF